jgi:hypothetical protein
VVTTDPDAWERCVPGPLWVAPAPDSPLCDTVAAHIDAHLDHLIKSRDPDGTWSPTWSWGTEGEPWNTAKQNWRSRLTVQAIHTPGCYGRIEGL